MTDSPLKPVRITKSDVYIDGVKLPGAIEEDGVVVRPGGYRNVNRLTVTFLVGAVETMDPTNYAEGELNDG